MNLDDLCRHLEPTRTCILLGAGASVSSGAPTGAQLARILATRIGPSAESEDLAEVCGIYENRYGRKDLVREIRARLRNLKPTQGVLALPYFNWRAIYSTNFDRLVEDSYALAGRDMHVVRSNYDFSRETRASQVVLYKIHGCVTQDSSDGSHSRMLLTEADYDAFERYRESLFSSLRTNMLTGDTVIIGQSLRDAHLRSLAKDVAALNDSGATGRVYLLVFEYDEDRAQLLSQRGIHVIQGTLENFLHNMSASHATTSGGDTSVTISEGAQLSADLAVSTLDVGHAATLPSNPVRLFNGSPATYADIRAGLTIPRAVARRLEETQRSGARGLFMVLAGAAGVGKTSLARALMLKRMDEGFACWEHSNTFAFDADAWLSVETRLREQGRYGVLLIDDCAQHMSAVNRLADGLGALERPHLQVVLTVNAAQWKLRTKSSYFSSRGSFERVSLLMEADIREMVNLVDRVADIRRLVETDFLNLGRQDKLQRLRDRCSADMFVCLKNIFGSERLDEILLKEFADLDEGSRDVYRHVAAIQALGGKVHRQLIMRLLGLEAGGIATLLGQMDAVIHEYDVDPRKGLFGWGTRHDVVAHVIATYKYADQTELARLLGRLIDGLNPAIHLELETARQLASNDMGIPRIEDFDERVRLLEHLIAIVPGERTPRRRLVRMYLSEGDLEGAERSIASVRRDLGQDDIIDRYRAVLAMQRAEQSGGLLDEDRFAMLLEGERLARTCITRRPMDRYNYRVMGQIGALIAERRGDTTVLDDCIEMMRAMEAKVGDLEFSRERQTIESRKRRIVIDGKEDPEVIDVRTPSSDGALIDSDVG